MHGETMKISLSTLILILPMLSLCYHYSTLQMKRK